MIDPLLDSMGFAQSPVLLFLPFPQLFRNTVSGVRTYGQDPVQKYHIQTPYMDMIAKCKLLRPMHPPVIYKYAVFACILQHSGPAAPFYHRMPF